MEGALRIYPWDNLDLIRVLPREHWFHRGYHFLSRTPTRHELLMRFPPFGLLHDDDWQEEMALLNFLNRRRLRRQAHAALPPWRVDGLVANPGKPLSGHRDDPKPGKKADLCQLFSQPQKVVANANRTIAVNFVEADHRDGHLNHCDNMEIIDGEHTVMPSIAHQSNYHLGFLFSEPDCGSARSESSFSDALSHHESDDESRMDVDEGSDDE
jgi:hypothetical protein